MTPLHNNEHESADQPCEPVSLFYCLDGDSLASGTDVPVTFKRTGFKTRNRLSRQKLLNLTLALTLTLLTLTATLTYR